MEGTGSRRIGVFVDGGCLRALQQYLDSLPGQGEVFNYVGFQQAVEGFLGGEVVEYHYVRGRVGKASREDQRLAEAGVRRHDVPVHGNRQYGAEVLLALLAYELSGGLDDVVLLATDGDFAPAIGWIEERGARVHVPRLALLRRGEFHGLHTSHLLEPYSRDMDFTGLVELSRGNPGVQPVLVSTEPDAARSPGRGRRRGRVARVGAGYAFIRDDEGAFWYMPGHAEPGEERTAPMDVGAQVTFTGSPFPLPGRKYPCARSILAEEGAED